MKSLYTALTIVGVLIGLALAVGITFFADLPGERFMALGLFVLNNHMTRDFNTWRKGAA